MKLRNPFYVENLFQDQPYNSLILVAPYCDFSCVECQNKDLNNYEIKDFDVNIIVFEYWNNFLIEGITLGGLEPFIGNYDDYLKEVLILLQKIKTKMITIYTRFELNDSVVSDYINQLLQLNFLEEIFVKTGKYIQNKNSKTITLKNKKGVVWDLVLASDNQDFHIIKSSSWEKV